MIRVSDEEETEVSLALSGPRGVAGSLFGGYLGLRRRRGGCLIIVGLEGDEESVARRRALAVRALRAGGAVYLGQSAGRSWEHGRFQGPYLRDTLMDMGAMVETLETSHTWTRLRRAARGRRRGDPRLAAGAGHAGARLLPPLPRLRRRRLALLHLHLPRPRAAREIEQWRQVKRAASEAIVAAGGTITHHHAVGRDHAPYMEAEVGRTGSDVLRAREGPARPGRDHEPRQAAPADYSAFDRRDR